MRVDCVHCAVAILAVFRVSMGSQPHQSNGYVVACRGEECGAGPSDKGPAATISEPCPFDGFYVRRASVCCPDWESRNQSVHLSTNTARMPRTDTCIFSLNRRASSFPALFNCFLALFGRYQASQARADLAGALSFNVHKQQPAHRKGVCCSFT